VCVVVVVVVRMRSKLSGCTQSGRMSKPASCLSLTVVVVVVVKAGAGMSAAGGPSQTQGFGMAAVGGAFTWMQGFGTAPADGAFHVGGALPSKLGEGCAYGGCARDSVGLCGGTNGAGGAGSAAGTNEHKQSIIGCSQTRSERAGP